MIAAAYTERKPEMSPWCVPMTTVHTMIGARQELLDDIREALNEGIWTDFVICAFAAQKDTLPKYFRGKNSWVLNHVVFPIGDDESTNKIEYLCRVGIVHLANIFFDSDPDIVSELEKVIFPPLGITIQFTADSTYNDISAALASHRKSWYPTESRHKDAFEVIEVRKLE